jgi:TonB dependent receptor-like, beta-barrel/TonB-dependent Receptor Plug Domain
VSHGTRAALPALALLALTVLAAASAALAAGGDQSLADALIALRRRGIHVVFSSALVTPDMRVHVPPRASAPEALLEELLRPHGLRAEHGPGHSFVVVRRQPGPEPSPTPRFAESLDVEATARERAPGPQSLAVAPAEVQALAGAAENVFRAAQTLPGVAGTDELDSRIAVRGGGPDQNLTVMDGVEVHDPYRLSGLVAAFNPETVQRFELHTGGFEVSHGDRLSSLLEVETRDGTSERGLAGVASLSLTDADLVLEGRLPGPRAGSWLVAGRRTYYDLVADRYVDGSLPSFGDVQAKLVSHPSRGSRIALFGLLSRENTDYLAANTAGEDYAIRGSGRNGLVAVSLDAGLGSGARLRSVASYSSFEDGVDFSGRIESDARRSNPGGDASRLTDVLFSRAVRTRDLALRAQLSVQAPQRQLVALGGEIHGLEPRWSWDVGSNTLDGLRNGARLPYPSGIPGSGLPDHLDSSLAYARGGLWLQDTLQAAGPLSLQAGLRLDGSGANHETTLSPRLAATCALGARLRVRAAFGLYAQSPGYEKLFQADYFVNLSGAGAASLKSERARHAVLGLDWQPARGVSLRAEGYFKRFSGLLVGRLETDAERASRLARYDYPAFPSFLADEIPQAPQVTSVAENGADGRAYGIDVYLARRPSGPESRLSGWLSYSWGVAEQDAYGRRFPLDYDRRHAASLVAELRLGERFLAGLTARVASGFPRTPAVGVRVAPASVLGENGSEVLVPARDADGNLIYAVDYGDVSNINSARLPFFARLDARLTWLPHGARGRLTLYLDAINVLGRKNAGRMNAVVLPGPGLRPVVEEERVLSLPRIVSLGARCRF